MSRTLVLLIVGIGLFFKFDSSWGQRNIRQQVWQARQEKQSDKLVNEGLQLLKARKPVLAAEKFRRALQVDPENDRAHAYTAQFHFEGQRFDLARTHAIKALTINSQNIRAHLVYGQVLLQEGKTLAAFEQFRKASASVADEQEKREAGMLLARMREEHPNWFVVAKPAPVSSSPATVPPKNSTTVPMKTPNPGRRANLAVFKFEETGKTDQGLGESLAEMLTTALINAGSYRLIERKQLQKALEEQALGQSGALDSETAVAVGKIMRLDAIVVGSLSKLTTTLEADARIITVETGEALAATHARATSADHLRQMAEILAQNLAAQAGVVPAQADTTKGK